jgi:hypothetical protein
MPKLSKPYPERRRHKLSIATQPSAGKAAAGTVLKVATFTASEPFGAAEFVYRTGPTTWETDFYNVFLLPPQVQIAQEVRDRLASSGRFGHVLPVGSSALATHLLEGHVRAIYGDFAEAGAPKAVIRAELSLLDVQGVSPRIALHQTYDRSVPIDVARGGTSARGPALTAAWNAALEQIVHEFSKKLGDLAAPKKESR